MLVIGSVRERVRGDDCRQPVDIHRMKDTDEHARKLHSLLLKGPQARNREGRFENVRQSRRRYR